MPGNVGRRKGPKIISVKINEEGKECLDRIAAIVEEIPQVKILTDAAIILDNYLNSVDYDYNKVKELKQKNGS